MTSEKKEVFDGLKCGNCGYDGGEAHLIEKMAWQTENHKLQLKVQAAEALSDSARSSRHIAATITAVICCIALCITFGVTRPQPASVPANPVITAQNNLKEMYNKCIEQARYQSAGDKDASIGIAACNTTFGAQINNLKAVDGEKK